MPDEDDLDDGDVDDGDVVFELGEWAPEFRDAVAAALRTEGIEFEWEGPDLVVDEDDADAVDVVLDRLEAEPLDDIQPVPDDGPVEGEAEYEQVSDLFLAADRVANAADDDSLVAALDDAAAAVEGTTPPFGVDDREWTRILAAAAAVREALTGADATTLAGDARNLRDLLRGYV